MIVARPINSKELCLIKGNEFTDLYLYDLAHQLVVRQNAPEAGWDYDSLELIAEAIVTGGNPLNEGDSNPRHEGWEAYLGDKSADNWIGSSEV